ncbi:hypothetical protein [Roseomonas xinghualingensis]|uniref:hypothetical protein n=1 Tax=Roseomonas xinghualingensis TaxID=2986475 RepID=UPI0021F13B91|nr:hypothetical protein [Roseomonas sp. SXEYE001]MCV4209032.1 hypothetical protein [Roseomonas sp. SXEYE001]
MPDALIPDHQPRLITQSGKFGGPTWSYRGATLLANSKETLWYLEGGPEDLPGFWRGVGNMSMLVRVLDAWLDHRTLPQGYVLPGG